ncbi:MAG TPA: energy transducer TonB, partial [Arachidicoccus sp.]
EQGCNPFCLQNFPAKHTKPFDAMHIIHFIKRTKMEAAKILQANVLDIVFENRNKAYGAYSLRKNYRRQLLFSIGITFIITAIFLLVVLHHGKNIAPAKMYHFTDVHITALAKEKPVEKKKINIPKLKKSAEPPKIKMAQLTKPVVSPDKEVTVAPPKQDDKLIIGAVTQNGKSTTGLMAAPPEVKGIGDKGKGLGHSPGNGGDDVTFAYVQVEATFPGGEEAWKKFLQTNLRENVPLDNNAPPGQYAVIVSFLVSKDGSVSEVKVTDTSNPDYGTAAEAVRVIQRSGKWNPAIQNGRPVTYRQKQRIIFQVQGE